MSNKFLALLILIGTISGLFLVYFYFFVGYTSNLIINSNIDDYQVELYSKKIGKSFDYTCTESPCNLTDISPFEYSLRVRKDGYNPVYQSIVINPRSTLTIDIQAIKEISLTEAIVADQELSNKDRISYLRDKKRAYRFFDFENGLYAYFSEKKELYFYRGEQTQKIGDFTFNDDDILDVKYIEDSQYIYFEIADARYLYDMNKGAIKPLDLGVDITYIKKGNTSNNLVFITSVGAYLYSISDSTFDYFYLFKDFVYTKEGYIGVVYADEKKKLQNLGFEDVSSNLIIKYVKNAREILYETSLDIEKIYVENGIVYFESEGKRYKLENL